MSEHRFPESDPRKPPPEQRPRSVRELLMFGLRAVLIALGGLIVVLMASVIGFVFFIGIAFANCTLR